MDTNEGHDTNLTSADVPRGPYCVAVFLPERDQAPGGVTWQRLGRAVMDPERRAVAGGAGLHYLQRYDGNKLSVATPKYYEFPGRPVGPCADMGRFFSIMRPVVQRSFVVNTICRQVSQVIARVQSPPKTARALPALERRLHFSVPAPGRPAVPWVWGIGESMVRECWSSEQSPLEEREGFRTVGSANKLVIYHQDDSRLRLVVLLGDVFEHEGQHWQPILRTSVERNAGIDPAQSRSLEKGLWDEICPVERRGRHRGPGRPKTKRWERLNITEDNYRRFKKTGLTEKQFQVLTLSSEATTQREVAQRLGVTRSAISQTLARAQKKLRGVSPDFSFRDFQTALDVGGLGQRRNKRELTKDNSGTVSVSGLRQELKVRRRRRR
jgi:DNA-binding CsgD family transcriptional regulator